MLLGLASSPRVSLQEKTTRLSDRFISDYFENGSFLVLLDHRPCSLFVFYSEAVTSEFKMTKLTILAGIIFSLIDWCVFQTVCIHFSNPYFCIFFSHMSGDMPAG